MTNERRENWVTFTRYLTYLGLCIATCVILQSSTWAASAVGLAVALYISVSEYWLHTNPSPTANNNGPRPLEDLFKGWSDCHLRTVKIIENLFFLSFNFQVHCVNRVSKLWFCALLFFSLNFSSHAGFILRPISHFHSQLNNLKNRNPNVRINFPRTTNQLTSHQI